MLRATEIKPDVYWVGGIDWTERNFHGYTTDRGSTYNAYLILDEKITLIDTCKPPFADELLERIADVIDPAKIDYVISNHVEQDHSGAIPAIMAAAPNAKIVTSDPHGLKGLKAHYGEAYEYIPVKTGDTLNIGKRTLTFAATMMVHWPDNMVTYSAFDKILFSNDAFGQHYASSKRFDDEVGLPEVLDQAKKYYANIVMPYSRHVVKALGALGGLDFDMIAPSHGIIWRSHVADILDIYQKWSSLVPDEYAIVVYDSMWHTTEAMAQQILEAFIEAGIPARLFDLKVDHISDIMTEVLSARYIAVGSPTLNNGMMPTVASFLWYLKGLSPKDRIGIPFGSYGWGQNGPQEVAELLEKCGFTQDFGILTHQWTEDEDSLSELHRAVLEGIAKVNAK
ncbi:MAG TPA: FprA family A-type flavoprotein [Candidatus Aveggerthella stercoripullorum]|uniref:FprA family A-type flavoprotein n=1 Tax=Candidatus Aveggerthella stercoripullorum TaxID=2840688 RepID=A0A9D1D2W7_9ACTN|nr:FprA family A-type flavoprotein [Candidatus Aveggerthella stercoripullorum]